MVESRVIGNRHDVEAEIKGSRATVERLIRHDPEFPKPFMIGGHRRWFMDEVRAWLQTRTRRQYADTAA